MGALKDIIRTVFPPIITKERHSNSMRGGVRRIVAYHSSGNIALQQGRYLTAEDQQKRHAKAARIMGGW